jgi:anthranilate synthase component 2
MRIILIDNYDSFTYNLVHYFEKMGAEVDIRKNDDSRTWKWEDYDAMVLSPGPGLPEKSGYLMQWISEGYSILPILGVCLGMQALALHAGGNLKQLKQPLHGVQGTCIPLKADPLLAGDTTPFLIGHYHSWVVDHVGEEWEVLAEDDQGNPMIMKSQTGPHVGVQYHPESVLTPQGYAWLENWMLLVKEDALIFKT